MSFSTLLAIPAAVGFIACILFVIFGQVTVRKLRKNPETKQVLGIEFLGGWDIFNVASALSLPKTVARRLRRNSESMGIGLEADPDVLHKHTTMFDRVLAHMFFWSWVFSGSGMIILVRDFRLKPRVTNPNTTQYFLYFLNLYQRTQRLCNIYYALLN